MTFGVKLVTDLTRSATNLTQTAAIFAGAQPVLEEKESGGRQFSRNRILLHLTAAPTFTPKAKAGQGRCKGCTSLERGWRSAVPAKSTLRQRHISNGPDQ
jgi:hypothetical protein